MRATILAGLTVLMLVLSAPAAEAQQPPAKGQQAVAIVQGGQIRASSSEGVQGFLLLVDYQGVNYPCTVTATGQVQTCYPLRW